MLVVVSVHRCHRTVLRQHRVQFLGQVVAVLRVHVLLVPGHNADRMDSHRRSVPDEVCPRVIFITYALKPKTNAVTRHPSYGRRTFCHDSK